MCVFLLELSLMENNGYLHIQKGYLSAPESSLQHTTQHAQNFSSACMQCFSVSPQSAMILIIYDIYYFLTYN